VAMTFSDQGSIQTLVFVERNKLEWRERPAPRIENANDAIVRPVVATTCDVDQMIIRGMTPLQGPFSIGHEAVGRVIAVGSDVTHVVPGDLVSIPWHISCGTCARCRQEQYAYCETFPHGAMFGWNVGGDYGGLFDDAVRVSFANHMLVKLPDGVDPRHAASVSDNVGVAWEVLHDELIAKPDARILIMGGSASICLYCVDMARALGATDVTYCDFSSKRLDVARSYGAQVYKGAPRLDGPRYDIVVDASGNKEWLHAGLQMLTPRGLCDSVGIYFDDVPIPIWEMYMRDVRFRIGRGNARRAIPHVLDMMARKCLCPEHATTETIDWQAAPECLMNSAKPLMVRELD
jgi:threonine dehydrogenase-like Zn-dependent dehydrogenase